MVRKNCDRTFGAVQVMQAAKIQVNGADIIEASTDLLGIESESIGQVA